MGRSSYLLGSDDPEIARLDGQAEALRSGTAVLLGAAGIREGMRVLELGSGVGHVAFQLAALVGPSGSVVAIDQSAALLAVAESRRRADGVENVRFAEADARAFRDAEPDADGDRATRPRDDIEMRTPQRRRRADLRSSDPRAEAL
jgi:precorrin-6B methylase 2